MLFGVARTPQCASLRGVAAGEAAVGMPLRIGYRDVEGFTLPVAFPAGRE